MKMIIPVAAAALLGAAILTADQPVPQTDPVLTVEQVAADSFRLTVRWQPVQQADGQLAPYYLWRFLRNGTEIPNMNGTSAASVGAIGVSRVFAYPAAGDSAKYEAEVAARDTKLQVGPYGRSSAIWVKGTAWAPPPAPPVNLDTAVVAVAELDSLEIFFLYPSTGNALAYFDSATCGVGGCFQGATRLAACDSGCMIGHMTSMTTPDGTYTPDTREAHLTLPPGTSVQACVRGWKDGVSEVLDEQVPLCGGPPPYYGEEEGMIQRQPGWLPSFWASVDRQREATFEGRPQHSKQSRADCERTTGQSQNSQFCRFEWPTEMPRSVVDLEG